MTERLTVNEYALKVGVSERTIWRYIKAKKLKTVTSKGKVYVKDTATKGDVFDMKQYSREDLEPIGKADKLSETVAKVTFLEAMLEKYKQEVQETKQENKEYRQELKEMRKDLKELTQGVTKALQQSQFIQGVSGVKALEAQKEKRVTARKKKRRGFFHWFSRS